MVVPERWPHDGHVPRYCYFESLGVGFSDDLTAEDIAPWLGANSAVLAHFTFSAWLSLTLLADSRTSLSAVLRGLAPLYEMTGLAIVFVASLISLAMFAGRGYTGRHEEPLYSAASTSCLLLWIDAAGVMAAGHAPQSQNGTAKVQTLPAPALPAGLLGAVSGAARAPTWLVRARAVSRG